jgi:CRP/FNR family transcriptional regulator, cyclic AMP receptor protein
MYGGHGNSLVESSVGKVPLPDTFGKITGSSFNDYVVDYVYYRNELIYIQEDAADYLYIVISGYVRLSYILEDGDFVLLGIISQGDGFGELGVHEGGDHTETASALGDVCVARIRADAFRSGMASPTDIQRFLTHLLARRYRWYLHSTCNLSLNSLASRLSRVLLFLCKSLDRSITIDGQVYPCLPNIITQSDLGAMARGTRGNVNRLLKKWERLGWVGVQDRSLVLMRRSKLEAIVNSGEW